LGFFISVINIYQIFDDTFISEYQNDIEILKYLLEFLIGSKMVSNFFVSGVID
jgi:hypothetical protein